MPKKAVLDPLVLEAALLGLRQMHAEVDQKITDLRQRLKTNATSEKPRARHVSAEGRRRMAVAQKKRWEAVRKGKEAAPAKTARGRVASKTATPKRRAVKAPAKPPVRRVKAGGAAPETAAQALPEGSSPAQ